MSDAPLIAEGLGRHYRRGRPWALRGVSLEIPQGSITALIGPNGAGKSTLIRSCLGFERPDEGRVVVNGIDPAKRRAAAVESVGYVPQQSALYRNLTIGDHFDLATAARSAFDRADALDRLSGIGLSSERPVGELSGGEQAQVGLALALGTKAPLLLLDEPLSGLDPLARRDFLRAMMDDVRHRGATAVLSSHIVTDVEQVCDRIVVLARGTVLLNAAIATARAEHRVMDVDAVEGGPVVGTLTDSAGRHVALVHAIDGGRTATLEDIVLGYLAAARTSAGSEAA